MSFIGSRVILLFLLVVSIPIYPVSAMIDTISGGPVPVPCCPENGMPCSGGADCINGICQKTDCKGPFSQCDCDVISSSPHGGEGISWIVLIGALVVIGAGIGIGAQVLGRQKAKRAAPRGKKEQKEDKEKVRYILQLSSDHVTVTPDSPALLRITTWKVIGENPPVPAPEATITLTVPPGTEGLSVSPASGAGFIETRIYLSSPIGKSPVFLTVSASVGKSSESTQVRVEIPKEYIMEFF